MLLVKKLLTIDKVSNFMVLKALYIKEFKHQLHSREIVKLCQEQLTLSSDPYC